MAKDGQESTTENRATKSAPSSPSPAPPREPDVVMLQGEIDSLEAQLNGLRVDLGKYSRLLSFEAQLNGLKADLKKYSKVLGPGGGGISPETLEQGRLHLEQERLELDEERKRLDALKHEIDDKLAKITNMQTSVQRALDERKTVSDERIKHLTKIYAAMPPEKAAILVEKLQMDTIIALFSKMRGDNVGLILPHMSPNKAATISERLAKLRL
jgi:flagellar motility protein MotE (MotC chaperone)